MKQSFDIEVECDECETSFVVQNIDVDIELDEWYSTDDYGFYHVYRAFCPMCQEDSSVDVITNTNCCLTRKFE